MFFENIFKKNVVIKIKSPIGMIMVLIKVVKKAIGIKKFICFKINMGIQKHKIGTIVENKSIIEVYLKILSTLPIGLFYQKLI